MAYAIWSEASNRAKFAAHLLAFLFVSRELIHPHRLLGNSDEERAYCFMLLRCLAEKSTSR